MPVGQAGWMEKGFASVCSPSSTSRAKPHSLCFLSLKPTRCLCSELPPHPGGGQGLETW